ncbi:hypothetical protein KY326_04710, partial [Candidatus Woesearchaeota archaeon]|nr:hypothetical protein [Candidatus Woesearchaeota archaeon]
MAKDKKPTGPKDDSEKAKGLVPNFDDVDVGGEQDPAKITSIPERVPPAEDPAEKPRGTGKKLKDPFDDLKKKLATRRLEKKQGQEGAPSGEAKTVYRKAPEAPAPEGRSPEAALDNLFGDTAPPKKAPGATDLGAGTPRKVTTVETFFKTGDKEGTPEDKPKPRNIFEEAEE